jgi:hypothetical protein
VNDLGQEGYVVCYDTHGGGLSEPSWGIHMCWGEGELQDEVSQVFNEIEPDGYTLDDIVILRIDESFNLKVKRETRTIDEMTVELERKT